MLVVCNGQTQLQHSEVPSFYFTRGSSFRWSTNHTFNYYIKEFNYNYMTTNSLLHAQYYIYVSGNKDKWRVTWEEVNTSKLTDNEKHTNEKHTNEKHKTFQDKSKRSNKKI